MNNKKLIEEKQVYIFDMDGTLYSLKKMHFFMAFRMVAFYLLHLNRIKDLLVIYFFRKYRDMEEYHETSQEELVNVVANKLNMPINQAKAVIDLWMFEAPLNVIRKCSYKKVLQFINKVFSEGKMVCIYSDYPVESKMKALDIPASRVFCSGRSELREYKPSENAMRYILSEIGCTPETVIYIGDRDEKDGIAAKKVCIDYLDIKNFLRAL